MRPQQQGRRSRNRGGGRRNQNPLQRSFESNGPDVKIRGNAQVIADKYATLARDALSSGDTVMAENYLQHAEHYNRIILAAQPQPREEDGEQGDGQQGDGQQASNGEDTQARDDSQQQPGRRNRNRRDRNDNEPDDRADNDQASAPASSDSQNVAAQDAVAHDEAGPDIADQPQPIIEGTPAEVLQEEVQPAESTEKPKRARRPRKKPVEETAASADAGDQTPPETEESPVAAE